MVLRISSAGRWLAGLLGLGCAGLAVWLAVHQPLAPTLAVASVALLAAAQAGWPPLWLVALPALLPWLGLGAWTGWLIVEEMDLAILAVAAGAYLRWAVRPWPRLRAGRDSRRMLAWCQVLLLLWTASVLVAMLRGVIAATGWPADSSSAWSAGWWQGYRDPLNALRLAKPTLAVLLLLPLWWQLQQRPGQRCADQLSLGLMLALVGTTLWCLWERLAYPGLLNMATDYRTTGPFWETHVGGAALDVWLALTLPFALRLWRMASAPWAVVATGAAILGGVYAGLTTFSRITYLALPLGAVLWWWLQQRQAKGQPVATGLGNASAAKSGAAMLVCATAGVLGAWLFPSAGYRGLMALLGSVVLLMLLIPRSAQQPGRVWVGTVTLGVVLSALVAMVALQFDKGAYWAYAAVTLATAALLLATPAPLLLGGTGFLVQLACMVAVAVGWGGPAAWPAAATAAAVLALAWLLLGRRAQAPWPPNLRWLAGTAMALVVVLGGVSVFSGGDFMAVRLSQSETDRADRWAHWRDGLALNTGGAAQWLGQGLGRYADLYALNGRPETRPGDVRLVSDAGAPVMRLVAGNHMLGQGELLRLSQRIPRPPNAGLTVALQVRAAAPVGLQAEVCFKHLLYDEGSCRMASGSTPPGATGWQTLRLVLPDAAPDTSTDGMLRMTVFSLASLAPKQPLELRSVALIDASGRQLLHNDRFAEGGARWFISSDKHHLPWHAKNLAVHLLVEQGVLGLVALLALTFAALVGLAGPLRRHSLAPALGAAVVGCWVVGGIDSVLDIPRVATWLLLLTTMAMSLHVPSRALPPPERAP